MRDLTKQHANARLDVVRGVAAIVVFAAHICEIFFWRIIGPHNPVAVFSSVASRHAVLIFFLLSGNLITRSITLNIKRNGEFDISEYIAARIARIYPPLIGAIVICLVVWLVIHGLHLPGFTAYGLPQDLFRARDNYSVALPEVFLALTMRDGLLNADGPLWSLFIEFRIYILVMAFAAFWRRDLLSKVWTVLLGLSAFGLLQHQLFYVAIWALGAATALWPPSKHTIIALAGLALFGAAYLAVGRPELYGAQMDTMLGYAVQLICCLPYAAILFYVYPNIHYPRALIATGNFSYSLYVMHFPLLLLVLSLSQNWIGYSYGRTWGVAIVAAIGIIGLTIVFARQVEQQTRFKRLLLSKDLKISNTFRSDSQQGRL